MTDWTKPKPPPAPGQPEAKVPLEYWVMGDESESPDDLLQPDYLPAHVRALLRDPARPRCTTNAEAEWQMKLILENSGEYARMLRAQPDFSWYDDIPHAHAPARAPVPAGYTVQDHFWAVQGCLDSFLKDEFRRSKSTTKFVAKLDRAATYAEQVPAGTRLDRDELGTLWKTTGTTTRRIITDLVSSGKLGVELVPSARGGASKKLYWREEEA